MKKNCYVGTAVNDLYFNTHAVFTVTLAADVGKKTTYTIFLSCYAIWAQGHCSLAANFFFTRHFDIISNKADMVMLRTSHGKHCEYPKLVHNMKV